MPVTPNRGIPSAADDVILDNLPDPTVVVDRDGIVCWVNAAGERRMGRPRSTILGSSSLDLIHPDDLQQAALALLSVQDKQVGSLIEVRIKTSEGWRLAEVLGAPVPDGSGRLILTLRDLTERRRWEIAGNENAKLRTLVQYAPSLLVLLDDQGRMQQTSGAVTRLLGHDQELLEGRSMLELVTPVDVATFNAAFGRCRDRRSPSRDAERAEVSLFDRSQHRYVPNELSFVDLLDDPTVQGVVVTGYDVSERTENEANLRSALSVLNATLDSTADGIAVVDLDGRVTSFNARLLEMWRIPAEVLDGDESTAVEHVKSQLVDAEQFERTIRERNRDRESDSFDVLTFRDGRVFERYSCPQRIGGAIVGRVWSFHDITRQKQLEAELEHQAFHDPLTGLANQALFRDRLRHAISRAERDHTDIAVLYFDLDDFKRINDSLGHPVGDKMLVAVTERLLSCSRESDTAARLGGDEFALLVEAGDVSAHAAAVAERLLESFRSPLQVDGRAMAASVSIGIARWEAGSSAEQLLRDADLAMYAAKRLGKGRWQHFASGMHLDAVANLEIEEALHAADISSEFTLRYQPIVDLVTGRTTGVEALVRWQHPTRGEIAPDSFMRAAEDTGVIIDIGRHVLRAAAEQAARWSSDGLDLTMSVNVSPRQLASANLVDDIRNVLDATGIAPSRLVVEITETAMLRDTETAARVLAEMKDLGIRLALDDFGTGFSSLTHLQRFPIDIIKIDRSFMAATGPDASLVRAVIGLAAELGLAAIAEGVETAEQVAFLVESGCRHGQGYFFAKPETSEQLNARWAASGRLVSG